MFVMYYIIIPYVNVKRAFYDASCRAKRTCIHSVSNQIMATIIIVCTFLDYDRRALIYYIYMNSNYFTLQLYYKIMYSQLKMKKKKLILILRENSEYSTKKKISCNKNNRTSYF